MPVSADASDLQERALKRTRRKHGVQARTISVRQILKRDLKVGKILYPIEDERPVRRGDCAQGERPCVWVGCRYNLYLDVSDRTGSIKYNFPDLEPDEMLYSCALDVADGGPVTLEKIGEMLNIVRERSRQLEGIILKKVRHLPLAQELSRCP